MYNLLNYNRMVSDDIRSKSYVNALKTVISNQSIVLDIGTGTGFFALVAAQLGARQVYAVEATQYIEVAKKLAAENSLDNIRFFQDLSTRVELPEKVSVIVSDLRGTMPLFTDNLPSVIDARDRFLAQDGILIPKEDSLWATLFNAGKLYDEYTHTWQSNEYDLDLRALLPMTINNLWRCNSNETDINSITPFKQWAAIDYYAIRNGNISGSVEWEINQTDVVHGVRVWFDADLGQGFGFTNAPGSQNLIYGNLILPWQSPVTVQPGDTVKVNISANLIDGDYVWRWGTLVFSSGSEKPRVAFNQSSFYGAPISADDVKKQSGTYQPSLSEQGKILMFALQKMEEGLQLEEIARMLVQKFPEKFPTFQKALNYIGQQSIRYTS